MNFTRLIEPIQQDTGSQALCVHSYPGPHVKKHFVRILKWGAQSEEGNSFSSQGLEPGQPGTLNLAVRECHGSSGPAWIPVIYQPIPNKFDVLRVILIKPVNLVSRMQCQE
jgi:hypothetical protein